MRILMTIALSLCCGAASVRAGETLRNYGAGTAGTGGGAPEIWATTTPRPGATGFGLLVDRALGGAVAMAMISPGQGSLNLGGLHFNLSPSMHLVVGSRALSGTGPGAGETVFPLPIPADPALLGVTIHAQAFVIDPAATPYGVAATPGLAFSPAAAGMLVVPSSAAGSNDTQFVIDLASGSIANCTGGVDSGADAVFTRDGTRFLLTGATSDSLDIYDASVWPPQVAGSISFAAMGGHPETIALAPDGLRAYVVMMGQGGSPYGIEVLWAVPGMSQFGTPFPGGGVSLGTVSDAGNLVFTSDSARAYLGVMGLASTPGRVEEIDTKPGSPTYNQVLRSIPCAGSGDYVWRVDITPDDSRVFALVGGLLGPHTLAVIDRAAGRLIDFDPGTPGIQNLGGEKSTPATALEPNVASFTIGPRGRFLYLSNFDSISRLVIDPRDANYLQVTTMKGVNWNQTFARGITVSDAGDRIYVSLNQSGAVHEVDTSTMAVLRTFYTGGSPATPSYR